MIKHVQFPNLRATTILLFLYLNVSRTSDSLNEGLPIKMTRETFQRKRYFFYAMECNRALVMSAYKVINCLISQPKHMFWVLKRPVSMRQFF